MYSESEFINYVAEMLEPLGEVTVKRMFGGSALCVNDCAVAIGFDDTLYFKVDKESVADYERENCQQFTYEKQGKTIYVSNWEMPAYVLEDQEQFIKWAEKSYHVALKNKKKPKPKK